MKSIYITIARAAAIAVAAALATTTAIASAAPARPVRPPSATAAAATSLTLIGTVDPQHVDSANTELALEGVWVFDPSFVTFDQQVMPASIPQVAEPYIRVPDGNPHAYVLMFHVNTSGTTTTQYRLTDSHGYQSIQTVADGVNTVSFTVPVQFSSANWEPLVLKNISGDTWVFYSCEIDEQTGLPTASSDYDPRPASPGADRRRGRTARAAHRSANATLPLYVPHGAARVRNRRARVSALPLIQCLPRCAGHA